MDLDISTLFDNDKLKDLLCKVSIAMIHCGVMCKRNIIYLNQRCDPKHSSKDIVPTWYQT